MKSTFAQTLAMTVMALSMMIAVTVVAGAQTVPGSVKSVRGHVVGGVITVVKQSGDALQSNDGRSWQAVGSEDTRDMAAAVDQAKAKRERLLAEVSTLKQSKTMAVNTTVKVAVPQPAELPASSVQHTSSEVSAKR